MSTATIKVTKVLLQTLFNKYNKEIFNGVLPNVALIPSARLKVSLGRYKCTYIPSRNLLTPKDITISTNNAFTVHSLSETLIHEMLHLYDSITNAQYVLSSYDAHGARFKELINMVNNVYPEFNIPIVYENASTLTSKTNLIFYKTILNTDPSYIACSKGYKDRVLNELLTKYNHIISNVWTVDNVPLSVLGTSVKENRTARYRMIDTDATQWTKLYGSKEYNFKLHA